MVRTHCLGQGGRMQLPGPVRAVVGLMASAAEEAKHLPDRAIELPMLAVSSALQMSLRAQQRYARLAARGDDVINRRPPGEQPPPWATFDEPVSAEEVRAASLANGGAAMDAGPRPSCWTNCWVRRPRPMRPRRPRSRRSRRRRPAEKSPARKAAPIKKPRRPKKTAPIKKATAAKKTTAAKKQRRQEDAHRQGDAGQGQDDQSAAARQPFAVRHRRRRLARGSAGDLGRVARAGPHGRDPDR